MEDVGLLRLAPKKSLLRQTRQEVSGSGVGAATTSTEEAQPMAMSTREQTEEDASGVPVVGVAWLGVVTTSQAEAT